MIMDIKVSGTFLLLFLCHFIVVTSLKGSIMSRMLGSKLVRGGILGQDVYGQRSLQMLDSQYDNYDDFLNLDKPIKDVDADKLRATEEEVSILPPLQLSESGEVVVDADGQAIPVPPRKFTGKSAESSMMSAQRKWPNWDSFMEDEFGDLDAELSDDDAWIWEARNAVEAKRGFAIWSKRSANEIKKEVQKNVALKTMNIPRSVANIIKAVHLDRTHSMKQIRKENELAAIEYRKWMIETRQKIKKDPLPQAKMEVSAAWLRQHPTGNVISTGLINTEASSPRSVSTSSPSDSSSTSSSTNTNPAAKSPNTIQAIAALAAFDSGSMGGGPDEHVSLKGKVVMDECTIPLRDTTFSGSGGFGGKIEKMKEKKENLNILVTDSMRLWGAEKDEMPVPRPHAKSKEVPNLHDDTAYNLDVFVLDGEQVFLPSSGTDDFYVVL